MRAALYARVSTRNKGQDLELQLEDLRRKAAQQGWTVTEYSDEGWSGSNAKRPALDAMMADVHAGKIDEPSRSLPACCSSFATTGWPRGSQPQAGSSRVATTRAGR